MNFQTHICPLCDKSMHLRQVAGVSVYECGTKVPELEDISSHYIVEKDDKFEIQHMTVFPYSIDTFADSSRSRIYKMIEYPTGNKWRLLLEVPVVRADHQDILLDRIQKLLIFI